MKISVNYPKRFKKLPTRVLLRRINTFFHFHKKLLKKVSAPERVEFYVPETLYSWYNRPMEKKNKLLLIDGSSVAFRSFSHSIIKLIASKMPMVCIPMHHEVLISC